MGGPHLLTLQMWVSPIQPKWKQADGRPTQGLSRRAGKFVAEKISRVPHSTRFSLSGCLEAFHHCIPFTSRVRPKGPLRQGFWSLPPPAQVEATRHLRFTFRATLPTNRCS